MPFIEVPTSTQDWEEDSDGYVSLVRMFKVWQVTPQAFWGRIANIPENPPPGGTQSGRKMPLGGDVLLKTKGLLTQHGASGENVGVETSVTLYKYTLRASSPVDFIAIAHYSNDPRLAPMGSVYAEHSQYSIVDIPIVRLVPQIASGAAGGTTPIYAPVESTVAAYLPCKRIAQTVSLPRSIRSKLNSLEEENGGKIVNIAKLGIVRFEGIDKRTRGPQFLDVTYNFTKEIGIKSWDDIITVDVDHADMLQTVKNSYRIPKGAKPSFVLGSGEVYFLPPYQTIELMYVVNVVSGQNIKTPMWVYRAKGKPPQSGQYFKLPGEEMFEWNIVP